MNSPDGNPQTYGYGTEIVASMMHEALCSRLETLAKSREQATPEFELPDSEECYQWACEDLRLHFKPQEAEKLRMRIYQREYWEFECPQYEDALKSLMWQKACASDEENNCAGHAAPTAHCWRTRAFLYRDLLKHSGLSLAQIRDARLSISNKYWEYEADLLEQRVALREHEMREALWKKQERQRLRESPATRPAKRSQPADKVDMSDHVNADGGVSSRTRSRIRLSARGAGISKAVPRR
ncbi:hypothetical protein RJ55_03822 [Drechmeria coniospora]|nr:hypothetical protein RJ55_03822 [Drechmeria coniospora]